MPVKAAMNRNQIKQVLLNVISNALDSMKASPKKSLVIRIARDEDRISISIRDTGVGMDASVLPKIFDPFFTTKPVGQGTGLGLSICQNIVKKHSGEIKVGSERGKGTTFDIRLPITRVEESNG
jgi:two-component system, NtrC family, sensor kinase